MLLLTNMQVHRCEHCTSPSLCTIVHMRRGAPQPRRGHNVLNELLNYGLKLSMAGTFTQLIQTIMARDCNGIRPSLGYAGPG